jgi:hypothetical protein
MWAAASFLAAQGNMKLPNGANLTLGKLALTIAIITGFVFSTFPFHLVLLMFQPHYYLSCRMLLPRWHNAKGARNSS